MRAADEFERRIRAGLEEIDRAGLRRTLRAPFGIDLSSNDYLGLSTHPNVVAAGRDAMKKYGAGATASPLVCGHKGVHEKLESALAAFKGMPRALVFPSGYQSSLATLGALASTNAAAASHLCSSRRGLTMS